MARIAATAETACDYSTHSHNVSSRLAARTKSESAGLEVATISRDSTVSLVICLSDVEEVLQAITKYRPSVPVVVVTTAATLARFSSCLFGVFPCLVAGRPAVTAAAGVVAARDLGLVALTGSGTAVLLDQNLVVTKHAYR